MRSRAASAATAATGTSASVQTATYAAAACARPAARSHGQARRPVRTASTTARPAAAAAASANPANVTGDTRAGKSTWNGSNANRAAATTAAHGPARRYAIQAAKTIVAAPQTAWTTSTGRSGVSAEPSVRASRSGYAGMVGARRTAGWPVPTAEGPSSTGAPAEASVQSSDSSVRANPWPSAIDRARARYTRASGRRAPAAGGIIRAGARRATRPSDTRATTASLAGRASRWSARDIR